MGAKKMGFGAKLLYLLMLSYNGKVMEIKEYENKKVYKICCTSEFLGHNIYDFTIDHILGTILLERP